MTNPAVFALVFVASCTSKKEAPATPPAPPPAVADAAPIATPPDAAPLSPSAREALCVKVLGKAYACRDDEAFAAALTAGAAPADAKRIRAFIASIADWPRNFCTYDYEYAYPGFSERWDALTAPDIVESCGRLGAALRDAGGLFGGDVAK